MSLIRIRQRKQKCMAAALLVCALPALGRAQSVWNGSINNLWSNSGNWNNNDVPGDSINEDATINLGTPVVDGHFTLRDLNLGGGSLNASGGNQLDIQGTFTWAGGSTGSDALLNATGSINLSGTLNNAGLLNAAIVGGSIVVDSATILNNSGTLSVSGATLNLRKGTSSGRLNAGTGGTILFQGVGSYTLAAGSSLSGNGVFSIVSAVDLHESVSASNLSLSGSLLGGTLSTSGQFIWSSGEMKGGGLTTVSSGSLQVMTGGTKNLESRQLVNSSTIAWSGGDWLVHTGASVVNNSRFTISGDSTMSAAPFTTAGSLSNIGTLEKTAGAGTSSILIPITNTGTVSVTSGTLKVVGGVGGGTWNVGSGATLIFAAGSAVPQVMQSGVTIANAGTLINAGFLSAPAAALSGSNLIMDPATGSELNIIGNLPTSAFQWNRGVISGAGTTTSSNITFTDRWGVAGGRTLENTGSLTWGSGATWGLGLVDVISAFDNVTPGTIQNDGGATITFNGNGVMGLPMLPGALVVKNSGEIKVSDNKDVSIHGSVQNDGTVRLGGGSTLNLAAGGSHSGTFLVGDDARIIFSGTPTHSFSTSARFDGVGSDSAAHTVVFDAEVTNLAATVSGSITLQAGADSGSSAVLNLMSGADVQSKLLRVSGGSVEVQSGATIDVPQLQINAGRMTVHGGSSVHVGSTTLNGILKVNSGATLDSDSFESGPGALLWLENGSLSSSGVVQLGGSLMGTGTIGGSVQTAGATVIPADVAQIGQVSITGGLTLESTSIVAVDVDADALTSDLISVGSGLDLGDAMLLVVVKGNAANLNAANSFVILHSAARSGSFSFTPVLGGRIEAYNSDMSEVIGAFQVGYSGTDVILSSWVPEPPMNAVALFAAFLFRRRRISMAV